MASSKRFDDFWAWTVFWKIIKTGSVKQAAIDLQIDPAVATRTINSLEASIGTKLLNRRSRPVTLTSRGLKLYEEVGPLVAEFQRFVCRNFEGSLFVSSPYLHSIRMSALQGYTSARMAPLLADYMALHAGAIFCMYVEQPISELQKGMVDVYISSEPRTLDGFISIELESVPCILLCSPDYLKENGVPKTPEDLRHHYGVRRLGGCFPEYGEKLYYQGQTRDIYFAQTYICNSTYSLKDQVLMGDGITPDLPVDICASEILSGRLVPALKTWRARPLRRTLIVSRKNYEEQEKVNKFVDWYVQTERKQTAEIKQRVLNFLRINPDE